MPIYVEIRIRGPVDEVWRFSQTPTLHERWDLRFTSIAYDERTEGDVRQRFRYATRIGAGIEIAGWGETIGERLADDKRTSALRFGSDDPRSLIRSGSGYWKYEPVQDGVRFITGYDYDVRWGVLGRLADALAFRPVLGWATAWSFDRLRLWIEGGVEPAGAARRALVHALTTLTVAFVWIWHGLVPKLLLLHRDELALLAEAGIPEGRLTSVARGVGAAELAFGLAFPFLARRRWPWILTLLAMLAATAIVVDTAPERVVGAFGPITLNLAVATLAGIGLLSLRDLPSAGRCLRRRPEGEGS